MDEHKKRQISASLLHPVQGKLIDLSNEILSALDIQWLSEQIKQASYLEDVILPKLTNENVKLLLQALEECTRNHSTLISINVDFSSVNKEMKDEITPLYTKLKSRLTRNRNNIFAIHGGGNIGLGLMADVVSKSLPAYNMYATSSNKLIRSIVNSTNKVWVRHGSSENAEQTCIRNIKMISREKSEVTWLYENACLAAICVTPVAFSEMSYDISCALINRYSIDGSGLKILILMNKPDCAQFVTNKLRQDIHSITGNNELSDYIIAASQIIGTVIDRIVTPISDADIIADLTGKLGRLGEDSLTVEKMTSLISPLNLHINLLNAERRFSFYVPDNFPEAIRLTAVKRTNNLEKIEAIKNKFINGPHAIMAWMGALRGHSTIAESIADPYIYNFIEEMMRFEIAPILLTEYPDISESELELLKNQFFERCLASQDDPVTRVGRDPLRKLDSGGRIRGTIELKTKHKIAIATSSLEHGIASGVLYALSDKDAANPGYQKIKEIYTKSNYSYKAVLTYCGNAPSGHFDGLDAVNDSALLRRISIKIAQISTAHKFNQVQNSFACGLLFNPNNFGYIKERTMSHRKSASLGLISINHK